MTLANDIESILKEKLQATIVQVTDISAGCGQSFEVLVVSPLFEGRPLLQRHRLVNEAVKEQIAQLHAFSQKTLTPAQYSQNK